MDIENTIRSVVVLLAPVAAGILALIASVMAFRMCVARKPSRVGVILATLPALLMAGLFYSLALHMHHVLGGWPTSIGESGFPASLITHGQIAFEYFTILFLFSVLVWPVVFLLCLFVRRWRTAIPYLGAYAFTFLLCFGSMLLAPAPFLNWWWD